MKYTIGIPTYNGEKYLNQAVESALAQDYSEPFEILAVNNASEDRTPEILAGYADRVRIETNPETVPMAANFNRMFELARGEYVNILNDDDLLEPGFLSRMDRAMRDRRDVGLACCGFRTIDAAGRATSASSRLLTEGLYTPLEALEILADHGHIVATNASLCHRASFLEVGGFQGGLVQFDLILQMRLLLRTGRGLLFLPEILALVRGHDESGGRAFFRSHKVVEEGLEVHKVIAAEIPNTPEGRKLRRRLLRKSAKRLYKYAPIIKATTGHEELNRYLKAIREGRPETFRDPFFLAVIAFSWLAPPRLVRAALARLNEPGVSKLISVDHAEPAQ
ncbi:glycosyltransferase family 2 protein [Planctomycetota bacterium]